MTAEQDDLRGLSMWAEQRIELFFGLSDDARHLDHDVTTESKLSHKMQLLTRKIESEPVAIC